jgi:2-dehydropantoate 2-reductase
LKIGVFGTGGVGGYFGGKLAHSGEEVVFIARGKQLKALQLTGLRVESVNGDFWVNPVKATNTPQEAGIMDVILVGVKAWQVPAAARAMGPMIGEDTFVVPLQNGVEAPAQLAEEIGDKHILGGLCRISSFIAEPGHIRHVGIEPFIAFGELNNQSSQRSQSLLNAFLEAGVKAEIPTNIQAAMWEKFAFISAISGIAGVTRAPVGVVRSLPETRRMLTLALSEIVAVADAYQVDISPDFVSQNMDFIDNLPEDALPSMQRDVVHGRPSELAYQNGAVVRLAKAREIAIPINEFIYSSLLPQELRAREELDF